MNILFAHADYAHFDQLRTALIDLVPQNIPFCEFAGTDESAIQLINSRPRDFYQVIIFGNLLDEGLELSEPGFVTKYNDLLSQLKEKCSSLVLFITGETNPDCARFAEFLGLPVFFGHRKDWSAGLALFCTSFRPEEKAVFDININLAEGFGYYHLIEIGMCRPRRNLVIDEKEMKTLQKHSERLFMYPEWQEELQDIGSKLRSELLNKNNNLVDDIMLCKRRYDDEQIRFCFTVEDHSHAIAFEAMMLQQKHIMLDHPVVRRFCLNSENGERDPGKEYFSHGERPPVIRCLLIAASSSGAATLADMASPLGRTIYYEEEDRHYFDLHSFNKIQHVESEISEIYGYLKKNENSFNIRTDIFNCREYERDHVVTELCRTLESRQWHIIHFVGHSCQTENNAYLLLSNEGEFPLPVTVDAFACFLRPAKLHFFYLSSCEGSRSKFLQEFIRRNIPAIAGFRTSVNDVAACRHAIMFYRNLFGNKFSLARAFMETRRELKSLCEKCNKPDPAWASSMLMVP